MKNYNFCKTRMISRFPFFFFFFCLLLKKSSSVFPVRILRRDGELSGIREIIRKQTGKVANCKSTTQDWKAANWKVASAYSSFAIFFFFFCTPCDFSTTSARRWKSSCDYFTLAAFQSAAFTVASPYKGGKVGRECWKLDFPL